MGGRVKVWNSLGEVQVYGKGTWRGWVNREIWREKGLGGLLGTGIDMIGPWTFDLGFFLDFDFDLWARKAPFGGVTDWYQSQGYREPVIAALVISISLDVSIECVGSSFPRVILIGSIFVEVPVTPKVRAVAIASPARVVELDTHLSSKADPPEKSDTEMLERHVSPTPHDAMLTSWRSRVASRSSSPTTSTSKIPTALILPAPSTVFAPSSEFPLAPVDAPPGIPEDSSSESYVGPSCKRCRSHAATVNSSIQAMRALVSSRVDLLLPHKRDVETGVDASIGMEVDVGIDVEDEVEDEVESSDRGTMEVGVDVVARIDIPDGMIIPDDVERLEQVKEVL
nr:hypothetical protein [Tanacetum cinerariifolium]